MTSTPPESPSRVLLGHLWRRKWLVIVPAIASAVTSWLVVRFVPVQYESSAVLTVVPQQVPVDYVHPTVNRRADLGNLLLSRTKLERLITDNDLYKDERARTVMEQVVQQMRNDIEFTVNSNGNGPGSMIRVGYRSTNPRSAQKVASQLVSFVIDQSQHDKIALSQGTVQFLDTMIEDAKRQVEAYEATHGQPARGESRARAIEREAIEDNYRSLLLKRQEARIAANLEMRQFGEQLKLLDPARIPERPVGFTRTELSVIGILAGLTLGVAIVGVSSTRKPR